MFCQKCGQQNSDDGKFCRGCGAAIGLVAPIAPLVDREGKPINWDRVVTQFATGLAFLVIAIILGTTGYAGGRNWWFWMLIPSFTLMGSGIAKYIQLKKQESIGYVGGVSPQPLPPTTPNQSLPAAQTAWAATPESQYRTGDLVPRSVTDNTTRLLDIDAEGQTRTLPKQ